MKIRPGFDFDEKYDLYHKMVYKICVTYLGNKQDAEDAFQEVFVKLAYRAPDFVHREDEKAWLIRIAINHCKNILKSA